MQKAINFLFVIAMLAMVVYPAWYFYQHPEVLASLTPEELPVATASPEIASSVPTLLATPAPEELPVATEEGFQPMCVTKVVAAPGGDGKLNVRHDPTTDSKVETVLHDGEDVVLGACVNGWCAAHVIQAGRAYLGFVRDEYVKGCE